MLALAAGSQSDTNNASTDTKTTNRPAVEEAVKDAIDAYIFGYPLVTMDMTRRVYTNVTTAGESRAPMGQFIRMRHYPAVDDHAVTASNAV